MRLSGRNLRIAPALFSLNIDAAGNSISPVFINNFRFLPQSAIWKPSSITPIPTRQFSFSYYMGKKKLRHQKEEKEDEEMEDEEDKPQKRMREDHKHESVDEDGLPIDYKTMEFVSFSRRLDHLLAVATKASRTSIDKIILQGLVRVNDRIETKKAVEVNEGADVQIFVAPVEENHKLALVKRICVMYCPFVPDTGYTFKVRIWKEYYTDNWKIAGRRKEIEEKKE